MKNIAFILLYIFPFSLLAQENKYWEEGLLDWSDFQKPPSPSDQSSNFEYRLNYKAQHTKFDDTKLFRYVADAYMIKASSSIIAEHRSWE